MDLYGDQRDLFACLRQVNRHKTVNRRWRERDRPRCVLYISLIREMNYVYIKLRMCENSFLEEQDYFFNVTYVDPCALIIDSKNGDLSAF